MRRRHDFIVPKGEARPYCRWCALWPETIERDGADPKGPCPHAPEEPSADEIWAAVVETAGKSRR